MFECVRMRMRMHACIRTYTTLTLGDHPFLTYFNSLTFGQKTPPACNCILRENLPTDTLLLLLDLDEKDAMESGRILLMG